MASYKVIHNPWDMRMISFNSCGAKSLPLQRMRQSESLKRLQYVVDLWRKRERWLLCQMSTFLAEKKLWGHGGTYRVSLKRRSLRDWHPKWFQGQPVKMCRCNSFLLVVSKAVSCSCPCQTL